MAARRRRGRPPRSVRCAGRPPPRSLERRLLTRSAHSGSPSPRSPSPSAGRSRLPTTRAALAPLASREGFRPALVRAPPPASLSRRETLCHSPSRAAKRSPRRTVAQHPPLAVRLTKVTPPPARCTARPPHRPVPRYTPQQGHVARSPPPRVHRRPQNRRRRPRARKRAGTTRGAAKISERRGCGSAGRADRGRAGAARAPSASAVAGPERLRTPFGLRVVRGAAGTGRSRRGASPRRRCCGGAGSSSKGQLASRRTNDNLCITAA